MADPDYLFHDWRDAYRLLGHRGTPDTYGTLVDLARTSPHLAKRNVTDPLRLELGACGIGRHPLARRQAPDPLRRQILDAQHHGKRHRLA